MKRIRVLLLTLALTLSMLAPEFAMFPAAYAEDGQPAVEQSADGIEAAGVTDEAADTDAASGASETAKNSQANSASDDAADAAEDAAIETADPGEAGVGAPGNDPGADDPAITTGLDADPSSEEKDPFEFGSYKKLMMTDLSDEKLLQLPEELKDKITIQPAKYGEGLLLSGTVADLNAAYITIGEEFNFDAGSVGRLYFDGLKDKDKGMTVETEIYLDDSKSPTASIPLKKQMGKKEWANKGDVSFSLGSSEISGKHRVALRLKITGKKDTAKTTVMLRALQFCKVTVPVMYFNIDESEGTISAMNASEDHSVECYGTVDLVVPDAFNADETFRDEYGTQKSLEGLDLEYIRGRGNSTWMDDKKPYKVKFDKAQDLFGFGKNKHWVLLANRYDNSLIRNRMTYWLGQQLGMEYTPQCVPVEVVMNGEYYGSYLLCEQIRIGTGRVTIDDLDDIKDVPAITDELIKTGGYLLSMEWSEDEDSRSFFTDHDMQLYVESPEDNAPYFMDYIKAYIQKVENAIFDADYKDASGKPYTDYLDIDSAVDYWWIQEFSENGDAYSSGSTYLYKKRESDTDPGKLYWGPLWDFDFVAWGDLDYESEPQEGLDCTSTPWFEEMKSDPVFIKKTKERWTEKGGLREKLVDITKEGGLLDKYIKQMETTYTYDHELWGSFESSLTEYRDEIEQLRTWINRRIEQVDTAVNDMTLDPHHVKFMLDGEVIREADIVVALRAKDFPEVPEKPGKVFTGWVDEDLMDYESGSRITQDLTIYANYIDEEEVVQPKDIFFRRYEVYYPVFENDGYGDWYFPEYHVLPDEAADTELTWNSSDETIARIDEDGTVEILGKGDAVITATLKNGVSKSFTLHIMSAEDFQEREETVLNKTSLKLKTGEYDQILTASSPMPCEEPELFWVSANEEVAMVDDLGVVTGVGPGTTDLLAIDTLTRNILRCKVTVIPADATGQTVKYNGSTYQITSDKDSSRTAMLVKAKNAKTVTIPATVNIYGKKYKVTKIKSKAFAKSKATKLIVKTKKLSKKRVKGALKKSKVTRVKVSVGKKSLNRKYVKKYRKYFTKKNAGKKVSVY